MYYTISFLVERAAGSETEHIHMCPRPNNLFDVYAPVNIYAKRLQNLNVYLNGMKLFSSYLQISIEIKYIYTHIILNTLI